MEDVKRDLLEVSIGGDGLECHGDPSNAEPHAPKRCILKSHHF